MNDTKTLRQQHNTALLCPQDFAHRMQKYWTMSEAEGGLALHSSEALLSLWRIMGETFQLATVEGVSGIKSPWRILQPPTGTGKTQGSCLYAAMQSDLNRETAGELKPVGILIATRLIEDANQIRNTINKIAGRSVAVVHHSGGYAKPAELHESDVVVITHTAFTNAKRDIKENDWQPWDRLVTWRGGERCLTIIDEALGNVIDESSATPENLNFVINNIPPEVRGAWPEQVAMLEQVQEVLRVFIDPEEIDTSMSMIWDKGFLSASVDFSPLISVMSTLPYDLIVYGHNSTKDRLRIAERVVKTISAIWSCLGQFAYYATSGKFHSINSAALAFPSDTPAPVVLDATARQNFLWDLFGENYQRPTVPGHARDYSPVTLHVGWSKGLGKTTMTERLKDRLPRIKVAIEKAISPERSVFLCTHKDTATHITATKQKTSDSKSWIEKLHFGRCSVGHWGAVDGSNEWKDYDTAVIIGLPYLPQTWATNMFCALQGAQNDEWLRSPQWKQFKNVRAEMEHRQMAVSVIQSINRIRCRAVIDAEGRCPTADIFILLPPDAFGSTVLDAIKADMPGINVKPWDFQLDPPKDKKPRIGSSHTRLIEYMERCNAGTTSLSTIQHDLQLTSVKKLRETLNNAEHPTTQALHDLGIKYVPGFGRGSKSYLIKAA